MRHWLAVISAEHAQRGAKDGFVQVCHGKQAPLRRMRAGDTLIVYAPSIQKGGKDGLRSFVTIGTLPDDHLYSFDMGGGFVPFRRAVTYHPARVVPLAPLMPHLDLTRDKRNWGYQLRFGLLEISAADAARIAAAMHCTGLNFAAPEAESGQIAPPRATRKPALAMADLFD